MILQQSIFPALLSKCQLILSLQKMSSRRDDFPVPLRVRDVM